MFAGLLAFTSEPVSDQYIDSHSVSTALAPYHRPDIEGIWQSGPLWLLSQRVFNHPESRDQQLPCYCADTDVALAFWGRLDNRSQLASRLSISAEALKELSDNQLTLAAWKHWGQSLPEHLLGDFTLAVMDARQRTVFLARDALGIKPIYYFLSDRLLAFASSVAALRRIKAVPLVPDQEWIARYLSGLIADTETAYQGVIKLAPGHCITIDDNGSSQLRQWCKWHDDAPNTPNPNRDQRWVQNYREHLEEAIRCRMCSEYPLGTENSGGVDSGAITSYLADFLGEPGDRLHSFGTAMSALEASYIEEINQTKKIVHKHLITAYDISADAERARMQRAVRVLGYPEEHSVASGGIPFYQECESRGIRTLFSGFGGDEVVTIPGSIQLRFELMDRGHYRQLWNIFPGNWVTRALRLSKLLTIGRNNPQYNAGYLITFKNDWAHQLLRKNVVEQMGIHALRLDFARYDAPYRRINDIILQHFLRAPYVGARFENCTLIAASYGVEYRWPLWDTRLVQQFLSTPSYEKVGPKGIGRYLHRRAISAVTPSRIAWQSGKEIGEPKRMNIQARLTALAQSAQREESELHPTLDTLIDRSKFREQIKHAASGKADESFLFAFSKNIERIMSVNYWLNNDPVT